jgi:hypothetical protein
MGYELKKLYIDACFPGSIVITLSDGKRYIEGSRESPPPQPKRYSNLNL